MRTTAVTTAAMLGCFLASQPSSAGDPVGVAQALNALPATWPDAFFSIDVHGTAENGDAVLNKFLDIEYEAAVPGYISYLRVSSHGDMTLIRNSSVGASTSGTIRYVVSPPRGSEQIIVLFSSAPLDSFFRAAETSREIGADRDSAEGLVRQFAQLQAGNLKLTDRHYQFVVAPMPGDTEPTTRSIVRHVNEAAAHARPRVSGAGVPGTVTDSLVSHAEFEFNSDHLTEDGKGHLDEFGQALIRKDMPADGVLLIGHTDSLGSDDYNMELSERRAQAAKRYLEESFNIPASKISTMGKGKNDPIAPNDTEADRQRNRRVDFVFSVTPATGDGP
jgi:outer membrane protein OmpA-like peptidoglycan-associated protein